jgi:hypothetical protein
LSHLAHFFSDEQGDRGQSLVEFALLLPVMLLIITGLLDVARAVWEENTLAYAAREGTRFAIVHGSQGVGPLPDGWLVGAADPTDPSDHVIGYISTVVKNAAIGVPNVTVTVNYPDTYPGTSPAVACADRNCRVVVAASAPFVPLPSQYMLGGAFQITLKGGSQLVIQR